MKAEPAGAEVRADGRALGKAGQTFKLPAAPQDIEVRLAGYRPYRTTITPRPGLPQVINVRLDEARGDAVAATAGAAPGTAAAGSASAGASAVSCWRAAQRERAHEGRRGTAPAATGDLSRWAVRVENPDAAPMNLNAPSNCGAAYTLAHAR